MTVFEKFKSMSIDDFVKWYEEKLYAVGKIPGSFMKREGKPADKAILTSRAIDRPLRPLFPKDFRNDVCVVATVLSVEQDNSPEVCAMIGAAAALAISDIPFGAESSGGIRHETYYCPGTCGRPGGRVRGCPGRRSGAEGPRLHPGGF